MARAARILQVINSSQEGGGARHLHALVTRADAGRFETMVATTDRGPLVGRLQAAGVPVFPVDMMRSRLDLRPALRLRRLMARRRFDLVHLHGTRAGFFGTLAAAGLAPRPRVLYTVHGLSCSRQASGAVRKLFARAERFVARRADRVISVSEGDRAFGVEVGLLPPDRTCSIPNGIDLSALAGPFREPFSGGRDPVILTVGRLVPQKGIPVLLHAARTILERHPRASFSLMGDGPLRGTLEAEAARLGIAGRVRFLGALDDPRPELGACDLFVLPSLWEGMPISLLEAMGAGRPAVATAVSGSTELVLDGETGLLVPPGDPEALAAAVNGILDHPERAAAMGARARDRARREFSVERMVECTYALYHDLLAATVPQALGAQEVGLT